MFELLETLGPTLGAIIAIVTGTWIISRKLSCAKFAAEKSLEVSNDTKEMVKKIDTDTKDAINNVRRYVNEEVKHSQDIHSKLFDKMDEIKDLIINRKV